MNVSFFLHLQFLQKYNDVLNRISFYTQKRRLFFEKTKNVHSMRGEKNSGFFFYFLLLKQGVAENFKSSFFLLGITDLILII